jgi:hypothetical protein
MTDRRALLVAPVALALGSRAVRAQGPGLSVPPVAALLARLETPARMRPIIDGMVALRTLLLYSLHGDQAGADEAYLRDRDAFFGLLQDLQKPDRLAAARTAYESSVQAVNGATEAALPVARRIEVALDKDGLRSGTPYSSYLLKSFLQFNQAVLLSGAARAADAPWYCKIYPLRVFCG